MLNPRRFAGAAVGALLVTAAAATVAFPDWADWTVSDLVRATPEIHLVRIDAADTLMERLPAVAHPVPVRRVAARVVESYRGELRLGNPIVFYVPGGTAPDGSHVMFSTSPAIEDHVGGLSLVFLASGGPLAPAGALGLPDGSHGIYRVDATRAGPRVVRGKTGSPFPRDASLDAFAAEAAAALASDERRPR